MTEDPADLARALHAAWSRGEFGDEFFHPDVHWTTPHPGGDVHGRDNLHAWLRSYMGAWDEYSNELEMVRVLPDGRLLLHMTEVARGRSRGVDLTWCFAAHEVLEYRLIKRYEGMDRDEADRRAGLA
jgi:hypothetical protein